MPIPFESLFHLSPVPILIFHRESFRILAVNGAAEELYGYSKDEFQKLDLLQIRPAEDAPRFYDVYRKTYAEPDVVTVTSRHMKKDGTIFDVRIHAQNFDHQGNPVRLCFIKQIGGEHASVDRKPREAFSSMASNMLGIFSWDVNGRIYQANDAFLELLGYSRTEHDDGELTWHNISAPDENSADLRAFEELKQKKMYTPYEKELIRKDGSRVTALLGGTFFENSREAGLSFVVDMTEYKRLAHELKLAIASRDEFLSIASHELRTPMTPLQSLLELALKRLKSSSDLPRGELIRMIESADCQVKRVVKLVNSLLDVSRIHTGRLQLERSKVNLGQLVKNVVLDMSDLLNKAKCETKLDLEPDAVGEWDELRLEQVIANLIANVCKYASCAPVEVILRTTNDRVRLAIRDQGPGIAQDLQTKIFDRFERGASRTGTPGFGLGLFISKQIVQAHGGSIWVESLPFTQGSSFIIDLPRS